MSCFRKWREEKAALLSKMDAEEKEEIEEWREKAKKELHDWYERRDEQLGKTQTSNRYVVPNVFFFFFSPEVCVVAFYADVLLAYHTVLHNEYIINK